MVGGELLRLSAGESGCAALRATLSLNADHSEVRGKIIGAELEEVSALLEYASKEGLSMAKEFLVNAFRPNALRFVRETSTLCRPRFMNEPERTRLRSLKYRGSVTSKSLRSLVATEWFSAPVDFSGYSEGHSFSGERERARIVSEAFLEIGCRSLAESATRSGYFYESHSGHPRLSIPYACLILAKMHGYSPSGRPVELKGPGPFVAVAAPISDMGVPFHVAEAVSKTESSSPLFDHHIALFPSCGDFEADRNAISDGSVVPVVLGERDGSCYFICCWK